MTEIVGLDQSIAYVRGLADLAGEHVPAGNEGYLAHLTAAGLQGTAVDTARQMQDAFATARAAAQRHAAELDKQRGVQHAYDQTPDAGDKDYQAGPGVAAAPAAAVPGPASVTDPAGPAPISDEEWRFPKLSPEAAAERRREVMRDNGLYWCPDWCVRDPEEDQHEQHWAEWTTMSTPDGDEVAVRARMSWWDDSGDDSVEIRVTLAQGNDSVYLPQALLGRLRDLLDGAENQYEHHRMFADPDSLVPAYDGAEDDEDGTSDWAQAQAETAQADAADVPDTAQTQPA